MRFRLVSLLVVVLLLAGCSGGKKSPVIGVSQCSDDIWRTKLNQELSLAAHFYGAEVRLSSANDDSERQMAQIRRMVAEGVDILIVSPNQSHTITPAIEEAYDAGVPVILFDRKIDSDKYTAFIGADNVEIGRILGHYIADILRGKGRVVEIQGLKGSSPAADRHQGFVEALEGYPAMELVATEYGGWLQDGGYDVMRRWLEEGLAFDAVFGQNDRMARGAWEAMGKPSDIPFFGVDALAEGGLKDVIDGVLTASYLYPTEGDEVIALAMHILNGEDFPRETVLGSALVDRHNASILLMQDKEIANQREMVEQVSSQLDKYLLQFNNQRLMLYFLAAFIALLIATVTLAFMSYYRTRRLNLELEKRNDELHRLSRKLEETTDAKLGFFTAVSHEFRTPLTLISAPLDRVLETETSPANKEALSIARENVDILLRLVNSILDFRKLDLGKMRLHVSRFDLSAALKQWMKGFTGRSLVYEGPDSLPMEADMQLVERTLFNLLSNAFKHTPADGQVTVRLAQEEGRAVLSVIDTGEGIPEDKLPQLFESFFQAGDPSGGTGIGLAVVKGLVQLHKGEVSVSSKLGEGSTFRVSLPLSQPGEEIHPAEDAERYIERFSAPGQQEHSRRKEKALDLMTGADDQRPAVLVVDDNDSLRNFIASLLKDEYRVLLAADGQEALDVATRQLPDLVVCDVMMPVMDGLEFCQALKAGLATSHIPVILLTAKSLDQQRAQGYDSGADAYIAKPFSEKVLLSRIGNLLKSRVLLKEHYLETGESASSPRENDFLNRFRSLVRTHLGDSEFSVEQTGAELGLSRVQLYRKVKALTGYSPVEVVRIMRLKAADQLLKTTDKTVSEIAYEVGFGTPSYFTKCYRELFGRLPGDGR